MNNAGFAMLGAGFVMIADGRTQPGGWLLFLSFCLIVADFCFKQYRRKEKVSKRDN